MKIRDTVIGLCLILILLCGCAAVDRNAVFELLEKPDEAFEAEENEKVSAEDTSEEPVTETEEQHSVVPEQNADEEEQEQQTLPEEKQQISSNERNAVITRAVPYTIRLLADVAIYSGPGYDYAYVRSVEQNGTYTVVEEMWDEEDRLWGKLKSGIGWFDLSAVQMSDAYHVPIRAYMVGRSYEKGEQDLEYIVDESENTVRIAFRAGEILKDVTFCSMEYGEAALETDEVLYAQDSLLPEQTLIIGVVFYGDMTTYSISFTDSSGAVRSYEIYISGRNGALILNEYT